MYVALMGTLSFLIAEETSLYIKTKRGKLRNTPDAPIDVEKLKDFKATILPLVIALVLVAITFYFTVFLPPPPPCTTPNVCNYLMSI